MDSVATAAGSAGGGQKCGKPILLSHGDADYQAILATFRPTERMVKLTPGVGGQKRH